MPDNPRVEPVAKWLADEFGELCNGQSWMRWTNYARRLLEAIDAIDTPPTAAEERPAETAIPKSGGIEPSPVFGFRLRRHYPPPAKAGK